jgi:phosphate transport system ATP-binding protein
MAGDPGTDNPATAVATDLTVAFQERVVVKGVNLELHQGRLTVVIGRSGSGKTTLLRAFNRLNEFFPHTRTTGSVRLRLQGGWQEIYQDGINLTELRRRVGMVFQNPNVLPLSVEKNISLPLQLVAGLSKKAAAERVEAALRLVGLWEDVKGRLHSPASRLSGGQQQRLCLARVLALRPAFLLLDEPTANLDFHTTQEIEALLLSLKQEYQLVVVSHSLEQARRLADHVVVMKQGEIIQTVSDPGRRPKPFWQDLVEEIF